MSEKSFKCFVCLAIVRGTFSKLTNHLRLFHGFLKTTGRSRRTLYCGNNDCKAEFNSFDKYRDHVLNCTVKEIYPAVNAEVNNHLSSNNSLPMSEPDDSVTDIQGSDVDVDTDVDKRATQIFADFFLELRAKHNVSHSAIDFIAKNIGGIFNGIAEVCDLKQNWTVVLPIVERVTLRLNSNVKRNRYYTKNLGFVKPVQKCVVLVLNFLSIAEGKHIQNRVPFSTFLLGKLLVHCFQTPNFTKNISANLQVLTVLFVGTETVHISKTMNYFLRLKMLFVCKFSLMNASELTHWVRKQKNMNSVCSILKF